VVAGGTSLSGVSVQGASLRPESVAVVGRIIWAGSVAEATSAQFSTTVAGGPFIGLLGTVWGVMETFAGITHANAATLTAMAPAWPPP
jgi:hypothetical protein